MGSISGVSGMSNAWKQVDTQRSQMQARLLERVGADKLIQTMDSHSDSAVNGADTIASATGLDSPTSSITMDQPDNTAPELERLATALKNVVSSADSRAHDNMLSTSA